METVFVQKRLVQILGGIANYNGISQVLVLGDDDLSVVPSDPSHALCHLPQTLEVGISIRMLMKEGYRD